MNAEKYTQKSLEAVKAAQELTIQNQNQQIEQAHLLAALLRQDGGLVPQLLKKMGVTVESLDAAVGKELEKLPRVTGSGREADKFYVSRAVDTALNQAEKIAADMKDDYVSVEHLLLALIEAPDSTLKELLMSAEYIMAGGNSNVILCERGIRTFETMIRNNLDISAIPVLKKYSHLPVVIDPSHAAGMSWMVEPLAKAAIAAGADGLMIEVHNDPAHALCDGAQSLNLEEFDRVMRAVKKRVEFEEKIM